MLCSIVGLCWTAQQQQEGRGSLEPAGIPGHHYGEMVNHRACCIQRCHCSRSMGGKPAFITAHTAFHNQVDKVDDPQVQTSDFSEFILTSPIFLCSTRRSRLRDNCQLQWHLMTARCTS